MIAPAPAPSAPPPSAPFSRYVIGAEQPPSKTARLSTLSNRFMDESSFFYSILIRIGQQLFPLVFDHDFHTAILGAASGVIRTIGVGIRSHWILFAVPFSCQMV